MSTCVTFTPAVGNTVLIGVTTTLQELLEDPSVLVATVTKPDSSQVVYTYGTDSELTRISKGVFELELLLDAAGEWSVAFSSSGLFVATGSAGFSVLAAKTQVTLQFRDAVSAAVPGAFFQVISQALGRPLAASGVSDASGNRNVKLLPGTYELHAEKPGYAADTPTVFTVPTASTLITMTAESVTNAKTQAYCLLYGHLQDAAGSTSAQQKITLETLSGFIGEKTRDAGLPHNQRAIGTVTGVRTLLTDANGYFSTRLIQGTRVRISIPSLGIQKTFDVPQVPRQNFVDIREVVRDHGYAHRVIF